MAIIDSTLSTLDNIRTKVRRLTRSPSTSQLSVSDIDNYVNNFVLYDFPETLRLFSLRKTLTFYTQPNVETYETNTTVSTNPLYNFKNRYVSIHDPIYVAGFQQFFSQSQEQFYGVYPRINNIWRIGTGNNVLTTFSGTLSSFPVLQNRVTFTSINSAGNGLTLIDYPVSVTAGALGLVGIPQTLPSPYGSINYLTGVYAANFASAPDLSEAVYAQTVPYVANRPAGILYYADKFVFRPVPDQVYRVDMETYMRPTELLQVGDMPELSQWWQYIAYGAAKKVFEDRMDMDSISNIMAEYKNQEALVLRRTIDQQTKERTATIYTEQTGTMSGGSGWGWGS
jgi:hypothetical protein